jgi:hypothetical protein
MDTWMMMLSRICFCWNPVVVFLSTARFESMPAIERDRRSCCDTAPGLCFPRSVWAGGTKNSNN